MKKNKIKKFFKIFFKILLFLILIFLAVALILVGLHFSKISKKQYAFGLMVDQVFDKAADVLSIDSSYVLGDAFEVEGTLKLQLSSEDYASKGKTDPEYLKKNKELANLSLMNTNYLLRQNRDKGKAYFEINEKIGEEEILSGKYLIDNSTKYYFVNGILENYVNDGSNHYFESFREEEITLDNLSYLYYFIRDSIKKNITEDELAGYDVETLVGEETIKAGQVSYRITDKSYKNLLKAILKDIKKDERASQIASLMYPNLNEYKIDEKKKYLQSNESYTINVYSSKPLYIPVKYELVYLKDDQKEIYTYEGDLKKGVFYYSVNNEVKYRGNLESDSNRTNISVQNQFGGEAGTIRIEKDSSNLLFSMILSLDGDRYDITYHSKFLNLKDSSYEKEDNLTFKIVQNNVVMMQGNVLLSSTIREGAKIDEDVSSSVLESSLSDKEKEKLDHLRDNIKTRLEK